MTAAQPSAPRRAAVLIYDEVEVLDFAGPFEVFGVAMDAFEVLTVALAPEMVTARNGLRIQPQAVAAELGIRHHYVPLTPDYLSRYAPEMLARGEGMVSLFHAHDADGWEAVAALGDVTLAGMTAEYMRLDFADNVLAEPARGKAHKLALLARHALAGHHTPDLGDGGGIPGGLHGVVGQARRHSEGDLVVVACRCRFGAGRIV